LRRAHNRNIATKIHEELSKLRAGVDASPTTPKRWVWELIQNAKDVNIDGKVRVRIEAGLDDADAHVTFRHNGGAFSAENIRFLIYESTQVNYLRLHYRETSFHEVMDQL